MTAPSALAVKGLRVEFADGASPAPVLEGLDIELAAGQTMALVGESGCGKTMAALAVMGLLPEGVRQTAGQVHVAGTDLGQATPGGLQDLRGRVMAMIFQEPMTALNPVFTVGEQIAEVLRRHERLGRREAAVRAVALLRSVQLPAPEQRARAYPHQLSGGMRQRVMIAMALACRPALLIADEPTTALDVTVQAQVFDLLREMRATTGTAILLITHDLSAVAEMADTVAVLYAGRCVEQGAAAEVLATPSHPYTRGLMACVPHIRLGSPAAEAGAPLAEIRGMVPPPGQRGAGCSFAPRCPLADDHCVQRAPPLAAVGTGASHRAACWKPA